MKSLIVDKKYDNKKLSNFILDKFKDLSYNNLCKALRKKDIRVNDIKVNSNVILKCNDEVKIFISDDLLLPNTKNIDIFYEDENIIIVNKQYDLEVTGDNSLTSLLKNNYKNLNGFPLPCHRLDRNTTGLVVFAKNQLALDILLEKFKNKEIQKSYVCRVYGIPKVKSATLNSYLFKDRKNSMVYISDDFKKGYKNIITSYRLINSNLSENTSILEVQLLTGRTHQIRAHLAYIGLPIIGDGKYGINNINKKFNQSRQNLCSFKLVFNFTSDSGILNYLNNKEFKIDSEKMYFLK